VDVFAPCALGGVLNDDTIPQIKAPIIAGTANNVLLEEDIHGNMIKDKNILYAPDFVINAGGLINVYHELKGYNIGRATRDIEKIYDRLIEIFKIAENENIHTQLAAKVFAKKRIETINNIQDNYIKR
jgi:leucine dehydrogenase